MLGKITIAPAACDLQTHSLNSSHMSLLRIASGKAISSLEPVGSKTLLILATMRADLFKVALWRKALKPLAVD